jgi:hypothetical protein
MTLPISTQSDAGQPYSALHAEVALEAYALFMDRGGRHGNHHHHWLEAEQRVRAVYATGRHPHPLGDII